MRGLTLAASAFAFVCIAGGVLADSAAAAGARTTAAQVLSDGRWVTTPVRTTADVEGFRPHPHVELSRYGGWKARRAEATGFFRTVKLDGRWWLVDPEGYLFISVGVNSVSREGANSDLAVARRVFGDVRSWADQTVQLLTGRGFNSLGCWSDWRSIRASARPMPYFPRWNFMLTYKNQRDPKYGPRGYPNQCMPLFDADFEAFCNRHARQLAATKDDPWLVGHFSDNELPFRPNLLNLYLELPNTDPGHRAARAWLDRRRRAHNTPTDAEITEAEQDGFLEHAAQRYYSIVNAAIKRHDPNHLYVGSRVHGRTIIDPVFRGARAADVVSVNYYHRWSAEHERMDRWVKASGRPFLNSEWYAQQVDNENAEVSGAGFKVRTQRDRGLFYQNLVLGLLEHPGCVGWHWFKYGGDGAGYSKGIVSREYQPHAEMLDVMRAVNEQVYPLIAHFHGRSDGTVGANQ
ncbi:MAG: hypothetical protein ACE5R4_06730 [Armatimonadota bacterium]